MKGKIVENGVQNLPLFSLPTKISVLSIAEALKFENQILQ